MESFLAQYGGTLGILGVLVGLWGLVLARRSDLAATRAKILEQQRIKTIQEKLHGDIIQKTTLISNVVANIKNNVEYTKKVPDHLKLQIDSIGIEAKNIENAAKNVIDWMK